MYVDRIKYFIGLIDSIEFWDSIPGIVYICWVIDTLTEVYPRFFDHACTLTMSDTITDKYQYKCDAIIDFKSNKFRPWKVFSSI